MSNNVDIVTAIFERIRDGSLGINIAYTGVDYNGVLPYASIDVLQQPTTTTAINGSPMYSGLINVNVTYAAGHGIIVATGKAENVVDLFPIGLSVLQGSTLIEINKKGWLSPVVQMPDRVVIPVTIEYVVYGE